MTQRSIWWRRIGELATIILGSCWIVLNIGVLIYSHAAVGGIVFLGLFSAMLAFGVIATVVMLLTSISEISFEGSEVVLQSPSGKNIVQAAEIRGLDVSVKGRDSVIVVRTKAGKDFTIPLRIYSDPVEARRVLEDWYGLHRSDQTQEASPQTRMFRARSFANFSFGFFCFLAVLLVVLPFFFIPDHTILAISIPLTASLLVMSGMTYRFSVTVTPNTITVKRFGAAVSIPRESISKITLRVFHTRGGAREVLEIAWSGKPQIVSETFDDFPQIRECILSMVSQDIVVDQRPG